MGLFSIYAPSTFQDHALDLKRTLHFWDKLQSLLLQSKSEFIPILMSDFNTRLYQNQLEGLEPHIGPYTFSSTIDDDLLPHNNLSFFN